MKQHSQKFRQNRKFAMVLPLMVTPFLAAIFWALGGGTGTPAQAMSNTRTGLNLELPDAHFNDEELSKLMLYEMAKRDSAKRRELRENDPYFDLAMLEDEALPESDATLPVNSNDPNIIKVNGKLDELYRELNRKPGNEFKVPALDDVTGKRKEPDPSFNADVEKLGGMMEMMKKDRGEDPEMNRINGMLDKILDVQHPERMRDRIREQSLKTKGKLFSVDSRPQSESIGFMGEEDGDSLRGRLTKQNQNSFFGLSDEDNVSEREDASLSSSIEAVVHDTQELVIGSTVKLRLVKDMYINGALVPKDQFVYGTAAINGERLTISVSSIRHGESLYPVSLSAYDLDGIEGIYVPGAITRDVAKQSGDQAMQGMQFMTMDQSVGAQAASAGMNAAKGLFSKKVKLIKVTVKAGYSVLLRDLNDKSK
ncbi:MAG: conjugative transposon protein TraM [Cyclobacteriaceae bacterium]|nr:conjugative transposon protein TraM [Cyclobacteriaceae bacterium]